MFSHCPTQKKRQKVHLMHKYTVTIYQALQLTCCWSLLVGPFTYDICCYLPVGNLLLVSRSAENSCLFVQHNLTKLHIGCFYSSDVFWSTTVIDTQLMYFGAFDFLLNDWHIWLVQHNILVYHSLANSWTKRSTYITAVLCLTLTDIVLVVETHFNI